jgi:Domain of unknown function (DUF4394)
LYFELPEEMIMSKTSARLYSWDKSSITERRPHVIHDKGRWRKFVAAGATALIAALFAVSPLRGDDPRRLGEAWFKKLVVIGLTADSRLVWFRAGFPDKTGEIGSVYGLISPDTSLVGIDYRVQDGRLYGVGNGGGIYTIDTENARATFVNSLTVPLSGSFFGVDFNPAADRLRIISDTGQNLAHNVNAGGITALNATLTYTAPPAAPIAALGLNGAAYTNNDLNQPSTATTLFDIDTTMDQVVIQSPPGNGILVATGKLGFDADAQAGFDIYSRLVSGVTMQNRAFASLAVNKTYGFYQISLLTGAATLLGNFDESVVDIAIPLDQR